jgi:hypothetical protein
VTRLGVDFSFSHPTPAQVKAGGFTFIIGYLSPTPAKNLSRPEVENFVRAGISVCLVWESTEGRALRRLVGYRWQTLAWSGGAWLTRAHLHQFDFGKTVGGHAVDIDRALKRDFGQFPAPSTEKDRAAERRRIRRRVKKLRGRRAKLLKAAKRLRARIRRLLTSRKPPEVQ